MKLQLTLLSVLTIGLSLTQNVTAQEQTRQPRSPTLASQTLDAQRIKKYLLGPRDVLEIEIFGQYDHSSTSQVDGEGNLSSLPFLEKPIPAKCRTEVQVQKDIAQAYKKLMNDPQGSALMVPRIP